MRHLIFTLALCLPASALANNTSRQVRVDGHELLAPAEAEPPEDPTPVLAWALIGSGVASLAAGATVLTLGAGDVAKVDNATRDEQGRVTGVTQREAARLLDRGEDRQAIGATAMGIGALLVAAGAVLAFKAEREGPRPMMATLPGGAALGFTIDY